MLLLIWLSAVPAVMSQSLDRVVVAASGSELTDGNNRIEFTIGETLTEVVSTADYSASQGFHQGSINVTSIEEAVSFGYVNVFPNPTVESVQIDYRHEKGFWQLHSFEGKLIAQGALQRGITTVDLSRLAQATYVLTLTNQNEVRSTYRVQKIL